jgi:hypothetical protein
MDDRIMHVVSNQDKYYWQANTCMLSEDHPSYSCDGESQQQMSLAEKSKKDFTIETSSPTPDVMSAIGGDMSGVPTKDLVKKNIEHFKSK